MPVFERPPLETLTPARERWTPLYLEHGRLEVDDSSVKWIGADRTVFRIPVATVSTLLLGPGTTVTHAAVKACADSNTPVCWIGQQGMRFYATGASLTSNNRNSRRQAKAWGSTKQRTEIARQMFLRRFPEADVSKRKIEDLRLLEGQRVRSLYSELGQRYGVTWKGRRYNPNNWELADNINRAISASNAALYALCTAVICTMGFLPQLGFIHADGTTPFVFDIADLYKHETSLPAAFQAVSVDSDASESAAVEVLKLKIEETALLRRMPKDLDGLFK